MVHPRITPNINIIPHLFSLVNPLFSQFFAGSFMEHPILKTTQSGCIIKIQKRSESNVLSYLPRKTKKERLTTYGTHLQWGMTFDEEEKSKVILFFVLHTGGSCVNANRIRIGSEEFAALYCGNPSVILPSGRPPSGRPPPGPGGWASPPGRGYRCRSCRRPCPSPAWPGRMPRSCRR